MQVPAGAFDNLVKVNREISVDVSSLNAVIEGNEINVSTTLTVDTSMWFAPHIGLVKQEINAASVKGISGSISRLTPGAMSN